MEDSKERVRRQLPKVPSSSKGKSGHKSKSSGNISKHTDMSKSRPYSASNVSEHLSSSFSPPGSKSRDFTSYSLGPVDGEEGEDASVTVAVRVRPFSERY